jgi:BolA protein
MDMKQQIEQKLMDAFNPVHLEVVDESHEHSVPQGAQSHFRAVLVSPVFKGMTRVERHKKVYRALLVELDGLIKAFSVLTFDPSEWVGKEHKLPPSPPCLGGSRHDQKASKA